MADMLENNYRPTRNRATRSAPWNNVECKSDSLSRLFFHSFKNISTSFSSYLWAVSAVWCGVVTLSELLSADTLPHSLLSLSSNTEPVLFQLAHLILNWKVGSQLEPKIAAIPWPEVGLSYSRGHCASCFFDDVFFITMVLLKTGTGWFSSLSLKSSVLKPELCVITEARESKFHRWCSYIQWTLFRRCIEHGLNPFCFLPEVEQSGKFR